MLDKRQPKVSVCVLVYNHEAFLEECLNSIISQKCSFDFEIIVCDDASTDNSAKILQSFEDRYTGILDVVYNNENLYSKGIKINPEINFPRCNGEYIAICEGDDFWTDPIKLQKQINFLDRNPGYVLSYGRLQCVDKKSQLITTGHKFPSEDMSSFELASGATVNTPSVVFRNKIGEWPSQLRGVPYGDMCFWSILSSFGSAKFQSELGPTAYRVHEAGVQSKVGWKKVRRDHLRTLYSLLVFKWHNGDYAPAFVLAKRMIGYFLRGEPRDRRKRFFGF